MNFVRRLSCEICKIKHSKKSYKKVIDLNLGDYLLKRIYVIIVRVLYDNNKYYQRSF